MVPEDEIVISVDQMRRSDAYTIENFVSGKELMYRAAYGVYQAYGDWAGKSIAILVGGGNNGGDGYALAGILKKDGFSPAIIRVSDKLSEDGGYYHDIAQKLGVPMADFSGDIDLADYDVIVDCILGTGFKGEVRGKAKDAIEAINNSDAYVISVDINSGMNGDTGEASIAVRSDLTVSIGYYKQGLFRGDSSGYIGELTNVDIGIVLAEADRKYDLICIGAAIMDSLIRGLDPDPASDAGFVAESGMLSVGGDAVNESIAAAKLGLRTGILCSLGMDFAGDIIEESLRKNGVDTDLILRPADHPTPITTIFVSSDGNRKSITNSSHGYNFHPEKYSSVFAETRAITLASLFRAPFNDVGVIEAVTKAAHEAGLLVFADTKLPNFGKLTLEDVAGSLPLIDYITPNETEARYYTGKEDPEEMADVLLGMGVKNVIIKLGPKGCFLKNSGKSLYLPAEKIDVIDATGAGDNFMAGFISEILRGSPEEKALRFANACGAVCTTETGAGAALKSRVQITDFLEAAKK